MQKVFPEKLSFSYLKLLFVFKSGREKPFPTLNLKKDRKNDVIGGNNARFK